MGYIAVGVVALAVAAFVLLRSVFRALVVWVAVEGLAYPFLRYPLHHNLVTFDRAVVLALGAAVALGTSRRLSKEGKLLAYGLGAFVVAYGLRALLTTQLPPPPYRAPVSALQTKADWLDHIALPFVVFGVAALTITAERWPTMARALAFLGGSIAALGILEWVLGFQLATFSGLTPFVDSAAGTIRPSGPYGDPTDYGSVLVVCIAATLYWMQAERDYGWPLVLVAVDLAGLGLSLTKTVWGAAFVAIVIGLGLRRRFSSRTAFVALSAVVAVAVAYSFVHTSSVVSSRIQTSGGNLFGRFGSYVQGFDIFKHSLLTGVGVDQYISAQQNVQTVVVGGVASVDGAHDSVISVMAETGLIGLLPLLFVVYAIARLVRTCRRWAETNEQVLFASMVLAVAVGYLILSLTFNQLFEPQGTMMVALVLGAAAGRLAQRQDRLAAQP